MVSNSGCSHKGKLLVVAPKAFEESIVQAFNGIGVTVLFSVIERSAITTIDPFGIKEQILNADKSPDAVLLVAPANRSPARLIPHPLVSGKPVGIVQPDSMESFSRWLSAVVSHSASNGPAVWAILSMSKKEYLKGAEKMLKGLHSSEHINGIKVERWFADTTYREDLCKYLAKGPNLAIYFGHARPRGWSGYHAVRWSHITAEPLQSPVGTLINIACSTLKKQHQRPSFGTKWINAGRACTFVGNVTGVKTEDNNALSHFMLDLFLREPVDNIGQLWQFIDSQCVLSSESSKIRRALKTYRIMGNPLQPLS
jgi:hypothetical protein